MRSTFAVLIIVIRLWTSIAQTSEDTNAVRSGPLSLQTIEPTLVRVPVILNGEAIEMSASVSMTNEERRAYVMNWSAEHGVEDADAIAQLYAALEAAALEASNLDITAKDKSTSDVTARGLDDKVYVAAAYETLKQRLQPVESDLADLRVGPSTIPGAGDGVFATRDIPEGAVVCEMRGLYVDPADFHLIPEVLLDRFVTTSRGVLVEQGVCSLINDCYNATLKQITTTMSTIDGVTQSRRNERKCRAGLHWNSKFVNDPAEGSKRFVVASERIAAGTEIYYDYGRNYWEWN